MTSDNAELELLSVRAAVLYYEEHLTQSEISNILERSRWQVGRLLDHARSSGFVHIEIRHPAARKLDLEHELCARFDLAHSVVVPTYGTGGNEERLLERLASGAADFLTHVHPRPRTIGMSWGRTLNALSEALPIGWATGVTVVQINGGISLSQRSNSAAETAGRIASKGHGTAVLLASPAILERAETAHAIRSERSVVTTLERGRNADYVIYSVGVVTDESTLHQSKYISARQLSMLRERGAIGDVLAHFISSDAEIVDPSLDDRTVGLSLEDLKSAKHPVAISGGERKHPAIRAIVNARLCRTLITDEETARYLLGEG